MLRLFRKSSGTGPHRPAHVPAGHRLFAIGDIHGRSDLLDKIHDLIDADLASTPVATATVVYLGDYIDRGPDSRGVLDRLLAPTDRYQRITLKGNHELMLEQFLTSPLAAMSWLACGGREMARSYGVEIPEWPDATDAHAIAGELKARMPAAHLELLARLPVSHSIGDYFFCHAGVRPDIALDAQSARDLLWIRERFLDSRKDFGKVVVHGHTPTPEPELLDNRIGIDTGAYASQCLTCLVLEGAERRVMQTRSNNSATATSA